MTPDDRATIRFPDGLRLTARGTTQTDAYPLLAGLPGRRRLRTTAQPRVHDGAGGESLQEGGPGHGRLRQSSAERIEAGSVHQGLRVQNEGQDAGGSAGFGLPRQPLYLVSSCGAV